MVVGPAIRTDSVASAMAYRFSVAQWAAYAPDLEEPAAWEAWAQRPFAPQGEGVPALSEMPAMARRRLERLGRMALQVAYRCQPEAKPDVPMVFASRHGDIARTHEMLESLARDELLSPTHFGLSTHNAIAAQYSIAREITANYSVVAAGVRSAEAGAIEAVGLLAEGASEVLLVVYDQPPPAAYAEFADEVQAPFAWAWSLVPERAGLPCLSLDWLAPSPQPRFESELPGALLPLQFFLSRESERVLPGVNGAWRWQRHA